MNDSKINEALLRMSELLNFDERSPGGEAEHLVFVEFKDRMYFVENFIGGFGLIEHLVGRDDDNRFKIFRENEKLFDKQSFTKQELQKIAELCVDVMKKHHEPWYFAKEDEVKKVYDEIKIRN